MPAGKSPRARLLHIRDEIEGVANAVRGLSFKQYRASYLHRRTVERAAQIVSEAARALPDDLLVKYGEAPWTSTIGIGNVLRHEYQRLDDQRMWEIVTVHLPALEPIIRRMIAELGDRPGSIASCPSFSPRYPRLNRDALKSHICPVAICAF